jgi:hypothetical protein
MILSHDMAGRAWTLSIGLLSAAVLVAGCGGNDSGGAAAATSNANNTTVSKGTEKTTFIDQAEAICREADLKQVREGQRYRQDHRKELGRLSPWRAEEHVIRAVALPVIAEELAQLRALTPSPGDEREIGAFLAAIKAGLKRANKNPKSIEATVSGESPLAQADELGKAYGFVYCENIA